MGDFMTGPLVTNVMMDSDPYIFSLDAQLLFGVLIQGISIFLLFLALSYLLFEPVKKVLKNRQDRIRNDIESAKQDKEDAAKMKAEYDERIKSVEKEADSILSASRKKALKREEAIEAEAKEEASRILARANQEIALEQSKVQDEMRKEIIAVATAMAAKIVQVSITEEQQNALLDETLKEMGDDTWLSR